MNEARCGVLLLNLGTPDEPSPEAVRRYLREFLSDPYVIDVPAPLRYALVEGFILPFRPRRTAEAYRKVWTPKGSPLAVHSRAFAAALQTALGSGFHVELAMRYGKPPLDDALRALSWQRVGHLVVFPLFPQLAQSSTGSALAHFEAHKGDRFPSHTVVSPFFDHAGFINAIASIARPALAEFRADHLLCSYHGLPERQVRKADPSDEYCLASDDCCADLGAVNGACYRAQCYATSRALAAALDLPPEGYSVGFQSRLGPVRWIKPYTDARLEELAAAGVRRLAVVCPSFVADCLETLEEVGLRFREQFRKAGGEDLALVPCVNTNAGWVEAAATLVRDHV